MAPTEDEINAVLNVCCEQEDKGGSRYPGMSFEQGIKEAIDWIRGDQDESPIPLDPREEAG